MVAAVAELVLIMSKAAVAVAAVAKAVLQEPIVPLIMAMVEQPITAASQEPMSLMLAVVVVVHI
jgi:hypothetical protein